MIRFFSILLLAALSLSLSANGDAHQMTTGAIPAKISQANPFSIFIKRKATLSAGTIVYFETTSSLNSREVSVGALVPFRVTTNVMAEKQAVITTGTQAMGRVKKITKATFNSPEVIEIEVKYVQAIDGSQIPLSTNPIRIKGTYPGQGLEVEAYTSATSTVMNHVEIELK